jgi:hypothetical protein
LLLDRTGDSLPRVLHWGADLGEVTEARAEDLRLAGLPQKVSNTTDEVVSVSVLPEQSAGWLGTPGVALLHSGVLVHSGHADPTLWIHGVVAEDRSAAVYALVATATGIWSPPGRVRIPGLAPDVVYKTARPPPTTIRTGYRPDCHAGPSQPVVWAPPATPGTEQGRA